MLHDPLASGGRSRQTGRMTATEEAILQGLRELEAAAATLRQGAGRVDLRPVLQRLDQLTRELPAGASPDLLHYLHKRSYEKARLFLEGRDDENPPGPCGHV